MLSDADLSAMRAEQELWLPGTAVVQTNVPTGDAAGGFTPGWVASGTVACRVMPDTIRSAERELGGAIREPARWVVTMPHDTDVSAQDRIVTAGRVLEVVAVAAATSIQTAVRASCVEVR